MERLIYSQCSHTDACVRSEQTEQQQSKHFHALWDEYETMQVAQGHISDSTVNPKI